MPKRFPLRVDNRCKPTRIRNKSGHKVDEMVKEKKNTWLDDAIQYCRENDCSAYTAVKTGLFDKVDRMTLHRRLTGEVSHRGERNYCRVLAVFEEDLLVEYIKNRNRNYQPMNWKEVNKIIVNILLARTARKAFNKLF